MKKRFKYITVNFTMGDGAEAVKKSQSIPICMERLAALCNSSSEEEAAINEIIKNIAFLCGYDSYKFRNVEGTILGGEDE